MLPFKLSTTHLEASLPMPTKASTDGPGVSSTFTAWIGAYCPKISLMMLSLVPGGRLPMWTVSYTAEAAMAQVPFGSKLVLRVKTCGEC